MTTVRSLLLIILGHSSILSQADSNPSQRNPLAPSDWGDPSSSSSSKDEPLSREDLLKTYLFSGGGSNPDIHVEDFLWTGSGESELPLEDFDITSSMIDGSRPDDSNFINYLPTTLTVTRVSTVVSTIHHSGSDSGSSSNNNNYLPLGPGGYPFTGIQPTPTYPLASSSLSAPHVGLRNASSRAARLPNEKYLVRTVVLSNMTVIRRDIERFRKDMELKLERAYRKAYAKKKKKQGKRVKRSALYIRRRVPRQVESFERPRVKIHNIRSSLPEPEIEMLYTVYEDNEPVLAETAVETLLDNVDDEDAEEYLGFPLITKAEPYVQRLRAGPTSVGSQGTSTWMITSVILCTLFLLALLLLILLLTWHRCSDDREQPAKHKRLVSSPIVSTALKDRRKPALKTDSSSSLDKPGFILDRSKPTSSILRVSDNEPDFEFREGRQSPSSVKSKDSPARTDMIQTATIEKAPAIPVTYDDIATSTGSLNAHLVDRAESPILEGLSPPPLQTSKDSGSQKSTRHRRSKQAMKKGRRVSPSERNNSAFPSSTPDRSGWLGPLSDLLEEDGDEGEDESRGNLPSSRLSSSSSTNSSPSPRWRSGFPPPPPPDGEGGSTGGGPNQNEDPTRAISAKSHLFRKGKVESRLSNLGKFNRTRPWSASDTRPPPPAGDPTFYMRQRHWEGLIAGKKHLHRGQLLPGSTSSEDEEGAYSKIQPPPTCWSEVSSPRKQVRIQPEPEEVPPQMEAISQDVDKSGQLIQAIKEELQRFQRPKSPNLTGISVINDPELVHRESHP